MKYIVGYYTDIGNKKETNQDSFCIKIAETSKGTFALGIICDGMGGLKKGELASATVVTAFSNWFEHDFASQISRWSLYQVQEQWDSMLIELNDKLRAYGKETGLQLGTTFTGFLCAGGNYLIGHVGDSRVYEIKQELRILTEDQTVVAREVIRGNITAKQAKNDPRRNVLLQCIGASESIKPQYIFGEISSGTVFMLCSDGFRHEITNEEIFQYLSPAELTSQERITANLTYLTNLVKYRQETDNISALVLKIS